jgi:hypothetical protein
MLLEGNRGNHEGDDRPQGSPERSLPGKLLSGAGRLFLSPARLLPNREIAEGAVLIKSLTEAIKQGPRKRPSILIYGDRSFDTVRTAQAYGISEDQLEAILDRRQFLSMRFAYLAFALGWVFFFSWCYRLAHLSQNVGFTVLMIEYAPFCAVFFLLSFRSALINFQIRTRRLATAREYLRTTEPFWPY